MILKNCVFGHRTRRWEHSRSDRDVLSCEAHVRWRGGVPHARKTKAVCMPIGASARYQKRPPRSIVRRTSQSGNQPLRHTENTPRDEPIKGGTAWPLRMLRSPRDAAHCRSRDCDPICRAQRRAKDSIMSKRHQKLVIASALGLALGLSSGAFAHQAASSQPSSAAAPESSPAAQTRSGSPETNGYSSTNSGVPENGIQPSRQRDAASISPSAVPQSPVASPSTTPPPTALSPNQATPLGPEGSGVVRSGAASDGQTPVGAAPTTLQGPAFNYTTRGGINNAGVNGATTPTTATNNNGVSGATDAPVQGPSPVQGGAPVQGPAPTF